MGSEFSVLLSSSGFDEQKIDNHIASEPQENC